MMQTMRQNMKVILWILVLAFIATIVFSWGMGGFEGTGPKQGIVATIAGEDIPIDRLENLIQQRVLYEQNQDQGKELTEERAKQIRTEVWDELVREVLISREVKRLGIRVTDDEIANLLMNAPPEFIRNNEYFQTDGRFDLQKYQEFLRNPAAAQDLVMIEQNYRKSLPNQKFINQLLAMVNVSDREAWQQFSSETRKAKARYVLFAAVESPVDSSALTAKRLEDYYYQHKDEYKVPEKRQALYTIFREDASREDSNAVLSHANELLERIRNGEDFATLAKENSEDRSAESGGDLGYFDRNSMVPEFSDAAFAAAVGEVVGPVLSRFGYHIIKLTGKKTEKDVEQIQASHILLKILPSPDTRDNVRTTATGFADEARESGFATAVRAYGIKVDTTDFFEKGGYIPALGRLPAAVDYIFARPVGETSPSYPVRDGTVIFEIFAEQKERVQSLKEVESLIKARLLEEDRLEQAGKRAQVFHQQVGSAMNFLPLVQQLGLQVKETEREFDLDDYLRDIGRDLAFNSAALALKVGELSAPVKGQKGYYLIEVTEKIEPDSSVFLGRKLEIRQQLMTSKQNQLYTQWLETAKQEAKIQDFRYLYYRDY